MFNMCDIWIYSVNLGVLIPKNGNEVKYERKKESEMINRYETKKLSIRMKANCPLRDRNQNTLLFDSRMTLTSK